MQFFKIVTSRYQMVFLSKSIFKKPIASILKSKYMYKPIGLSSLISRRYGWTGAGAEFTTAAAEKPNVLRPHCCVLQSLGGDLAAVGNTLQSDWRPSPGLAAVMLMKQLDV